MTDLYADLGVDRDAAPHTISTAYRKRAKAAHPDAGGDAAEFDRIARAAMVLRDPAKKARYDETGQFEEGPDNTAAAIAGLQVAAFNAAMGQGDYRIVNVIRRAEVLLRGDKSKIEKAIADLNTEKKAVASARKRLKFKGTGRNVIGDMLNQKDAQLDSALAQGEVELANVEAAMAGMKDFDWEVDPEPQPMSSAEINARMYSNHDAYEARRGGPFAFR